MPPEFIIKQFHNTHKKTYVLSMYALRPATLFKRDANTCFPVDIWKFQKDLFWRTSVYACFWRDFRKWFIRTFFPESRFQKPSWLSNITKIPVAFKPEPSLTFAPKFYSELRFPMFIINGYDRKENACSPWTSCNNITVPRNISIKFITTYHKSLFITT